jgi:hypothetical protein
VELYIVGCIAIGCDDRTDPPTLHLARYRALDEERDSRRLKAAALVPAVVAKPVAKPARAAPLKGKRLEPVVAELTTVCSAARAAWHLGNVRRRALETLDSWLRRPRYTTEATFPSILRLYEKRVIKMRQWFGGQTFATAIEHQAYLTSEAEDFGRPYNEEERWLRVWIYLCSLRGVGRPTALTIAGRKPTGYEKRLRERGGVAARNENSLNTEINAERRSLATALENVKQLGRDSTPTPTLAEIEARFARISMLDTLVKDLRRWRAHVGEQPLWAELVALRERRLMAVAALMVDSEPWNITATG